MSVRCVIGLQWGDEGKGKIVDILSADSDVVVRYQGGSNAGHTVVINNEKFILHLLPTGILHPGIKCVIGNGVVIEPELLLKEINGLKKRGVRVDGRLFISERAHIVFPYHKILDGLSETKLGQAKIGTTGRGIGPAYTDKFARRGLRAIDLYEPDIFQAMLKSNLAFLKQWLPNSFKAQEESCRSLSFRKIYRDYLAYAAIIKPYIIDTRLLIKEAIASGKRVLFEGAQGTLLNIDLGTYPYVTSSHSDITGVSGGTGIAPKFISNIVGLLKAYTTRVGSGPFPTELLDKTGEELRSQGGEYGSTTGRPRRCGWLDLVAARYATEINGADAIAITKLDVLSSLKDIKIAVGYKYRGKIQSDFPANLKILQNIQPVYKTFRGWGKSLAGITKYKALPVYTRKYLEFIEKQLDVPIKIISIGAERSETIYR